MIFRRASRVERNAKRFAEECEAFLAGDALRLVGSPRGRPPTWTQINWMAHTAPSSVVDRFRSEIGLRRPAGTWPWAVSTLVDELVAIAAGDERVIGQLQRDCLIPMELVLLRSDAACFLPAHLVALGVPRLRSHPAADSPERSDSLPDD